MRRLAFIALVAAAACGRVSKTDPGPADGFYRPSGLAVYQGKLVVASSNSDLRYDTATGGTLIKVDPLAPRIAGAAHDAPLEGTVRIESFAGRLAIADAAACGLARPLVLVPVRGANALYRAAILEDGSLSCDGCGLPLGSNSLSDAFSVGVACGPGLARAYVGYLRSSLGEAGVTQVDLAKDPSADGAIQHAAYGLGQVRSFAYDAPRRRLYLTRTATGATTSLRWVDLAGGCRIDLAQAAGGCRIGESVAGAVPRGLELRSIALANAEATPRRAYLTARVYDADVAAAVGSRVGDFDGVLLVVDLVETLGGQLDLRIVRQLPIGYGAADVVVLPARTGKRDVVAALAADDGVLWVYDDETGSAVAIGRDLLRPQGAGTPTGAPEVGRAPSALAVDPVPLAGNVARLYVASFEESFVTPIDVPLDDPEGACLLNGAGACAAFPDDARRITGGVAGVTP